MMNTLKNAILYIFFSAFISGCTVNLATSSLKSTQGVESAEKKTTEQIAAAKTEQSVNKKVNVNEQASLGNWFSFEQQRILSRVNNFTNLEIITVTASQAERSAGDKHDFYSEGDYWWPDPTTPDGPYIRRDGESNPNNFNDHRKAMVRLADIVGTLASAYVITKNDSYVSDAARHLNAWFVDPSTRMNPSLEYGQAIKGRFTGRSIGIIDTLHLVEVARAIDVMQQSPSLQPHLSEIKAWFTSYLTWMNSHPYGLEEKMHPNNHGACWSLQAGTFAALVGNRAVIDWIDNQFKTVYLQEMMNDQGGFKDELTRTKPYGYSLFMIDVMAGIAQLLKLQEQDVWQYQSANNKSLALGMYFIYPYIADKTSWPFQQDILFWGAWPVRHASLLFSGLAFDKVDYIETWKTLEADPNIVEIKRNLPIRYPLLWQTK